jgi:aromatic-amino-acid transaminase
MMFETLPTHAPDGLLQIIKDHAADPRPNKIDVGVGVYRDEDGQTPVLAAVKAAEAVLLETQMTKSYLGADGDAGFTRLLAELVFGPGGGERDDITGVQTPGGTGALRLGAEMIRRARPDATVWVWAPTWANHPPIFKAAGLRLNEIDAYDINSGLLDMAKIEQALRGAKRGDVVLLHAACHNPTGADPTMAEWWRLADICREQKLLPFIDCAYQGLGDGLEEDVAGLRLMVDHVDDAIIAYSCDKNFGLYRDRVGAFWTKAKAQSINAVRSNILELTRSNWSMPPDHGAAVVRIILDSKELHQRWQNELDTMRTRINSIRQILADSDPRLAFMARQRGLFAMLPLSLKQVNELRNQYAIYMASSGRMNIAGLARRQLPHFLRSFHLIQQS